MSRAGCSAKVPMRSLLAHLAQVQFGSSNFAGASGYECWGTAPVIPSTPKRAPAVFPELKAPVTPVSAKTAPLEVESDPVPAPDPADAALLESLHEPTPQSGFQHNAQGIRLAAAENSVRSNGLRTAARRRSSWKSGAHSAACYRAVGRLSGGAAAAPAMAKESLESAAELAASSILTHRKELASG